MKENCTVTKIVSLSVRIWREITKDKIVSRRANLYIWRGIINNKIVSHTVSLYVCMEGN